jgi:hypothetical protein
MRIKIEAGLIALLGSLALAQTPGAVPKIWNDADLQEWATPIAGLNVRPGHFSEEEYYAAPADNLRTYPVYPPDREPPGYWEWLQQQKPEPLVDISKIRTEADWVTEGGRAFRELDVVSARTNDPDIIARARDPGSFANVFTAEDGSVLDPRWVVTDNGLMLTVSDCASCHVRIDLPATVSFGGPLNPWPMNTSLQVRPPGVPMAGFFLRQLEGRFPGESLGMALWRSAVVPWAPDERVERLRDISEPGTLGVLFGGNSGTIPRTNGSPFYGTKVPDLQTLQYNRYLEATGTRRLRGPGDVARYIALITGADVMDFGPHHILDDKQRHVTFRFADEILYAIAVYLLSLEPPKNPDTSPPEVLERGRRVFQSEGCGTCHVPPDYTNGKLTPAQGYEPASDHPNGGDILGISVATDPGLALKTRKGTGFYKVPSLRGLWYRPFLLHDGTIGSLEEMFDLARFSPEYIPRGWKEPGTEMRAIRGHEYGLDLNSEDKRYLFAFLRSL